jgi:glycolate oxidase FAD binding subunit
VFAPLKAPLDRIHRQMKTAFDPDGVFNPGRLYPGL